MHSSLKPKLIRDNSLKNKNHNYSLKNLQPLQITKQILQVSFQKLISNSTRNISNNSKKLDKLYQNTRIALPSVQNRLKQVKNKQNIKFPQILTKYKRSQKLILNKQKIHLSDINTKKKHKQQQKIKKKFDYRNKIHTQPIQKINFSTLNHKQSNNNNINKLTNKNININLNNNNNSCCLTKIKSSNRYKKINKDKQPPVIKKQKQNFKQVLLDILNSQRRNSITIEDEMDRLEELTRKSGDLRVSLRGIQQDMLSLNLKKKLSKIVGRKSINCSMIL